MTAYPRKLRILDDTSWSHHRSGWRLAVQAVAEHLQTEGGVAFVSSVDAVILARRAISEPWVGFFHGPVHFAEADRQLTGVDAGLDGLLCTEAWKRSAPWCRGLFTLCQHTRAYLESRVDIPAASVLLPTERVERVFTFEKFLANPEQKLLHIGWWARRLPSFFDLPVTRYRKVWLKSACADYARLHLLPPATVTVQARVSDGDYDRLLENNLVFLDFEDTAANNTVVECIVRHTPLLIRRLPAVVEYLGPEYPLYFTTLDEAAGKIEDPDLIRRATDYLQGWRLQDQLSVTHFLESVASSEIYRTHLPRPAVTYRNPASTNEIARPAPAEPKRMPRLLYCSYHSYFDPSSGAALATRDLFELLAARGWECQVLCGSRTDFEEEPSFPRIFAQEGIAYEVRYSTREPAPFLVFKCRPSGVRATVFTVPTCHRYAPPSPPQREPTPAQGLAFLALYDRLLERSRPDLLLTYGGDWLAREVIARAKRAGVRVVFALHNFAYNDRDFFRPVDAVLVPSEFAREYYGRTLGLACTAIPGPWNWSKVRCPEITGRYVTFVNPQPHKGVFLFARIAHELWRRRPDISLLVVEGRAKASWLARTGLDLRGVRNLFFMANTPDPRDFYRVSRLVLMPSLWNESFSRVATEALINGIPVLASRRGGLPETLARAGCLFDVPAQYTPESRSVPDAAEIAPWVETIIRLWDDESLYERERQRCLMAAEDWRPERLIARFEKFFQTVIQATRPSPP
jgi:glycosyltransferase involved in cell wall biosynthesis